MIFTVIIFMFIVIVSSAMLSMVSSNYVSRVVGGKRLQNLYGAESGLDIAYNVLVNTIDNANQVAYKEVEAFKNEVKDMDYTDYKREQDDTKKALYALYADIDYLKLEEEKNKKKIEEDNELVEQLINYVFRNKFKQYINENIKNNVEGEKGKYWIGSADGTKEQQEVEYNQANIKFYNNRDFTDESSNIKWKKKDGSDEIKIKTNDPERKLVVKYIFNDDGKPEPDKDAEYSLEKFQYYEKENTEIALESKFKENNTSKMIGSNERKLRTIYTLTVPNYYEVTFKNSIVTNTSDIPGITVKGNLKVKNSNLDVHGDILVEGDSSEFEADPLKKYTKGIFLDSKSNKSINFLNNIYCRESINIKDNVTVNVNRNVYAKNLYINSENDNTEKSILNINTDDDSKLVLDNDLELNANNAFVNIKNFYGINDKNDVSDKSDNMKKSSSIIINKQNSNSILTINKEAYIRGVAHINTEKGYKTGESVAVKGNYNAYSIPINGNESFIYDNPLQLIDGTINEKSEHFFNYWKNENESTNNIVAAKDRLDSGGVIFNEINNVHSIGTIVYDEINKENNSIAKKIKKAEDFGTSTAIENTIKNEQKEYAKNICNLNVGNNKVDKEYDNYNDSMISIDSILNLDELNSNISGIKFEFINGNHEIANVNNNSEEGENTSKNAEILKKEGVLIVNGDLTIKGKVDIEGDLIVLGDLNIEDGDVNIKYNKSLTKDIQNRNLSKFYSVFGSEYGGKDLNTSTSENTESNASQFITKLWKVGK